MPMGKLILACVVALSVTTQHASETRAVSLPAPIGMSQRGPVRLCSLYNMPINDVLNDGFGCRHSVSSVPPDSSTYLMGEEYVYYAIGQRISHIYLWQRVKTRWLLWSTYRETPTHGIVTGGLSQVFYHDDSDPDIHFYRPDDPPQDCGDRFMVVATRDTGAFLGQVPFTISC